ncbi:hypothetical protein AB852_05290 [Streptomyces uncialis]|uniref:Uncharacterized protein n=1 Tax=Streptomyces uncialis TaxID=1048205 RepID=A0A1Q4VE54_9ACTN|nr:hypothetical protein AB852_05290 [Streptomyces uncialis]
MPDSRTSGIRLWVPRLGLLSAGAVPEGRVGAAVRPGCAVPDGVLPGDAAVAPLGWEYAGARLTGAAPGPRRSLTVVSPLSATYAEQPPANAVAVTTARDVRQARVRAPGGATRPPAATVPGGGTRPPSAAVRPLRPSPLY